MANRYALWNKKDELYTPSGAIISPEAWIEEFGWIKNPRAVPVISAGLINGGFSGELSQMKEMAERDGAVFDEGLSNQELLEAIEAFQDERNAPVDPDTLPPTVEERTAAALEFIAMNSLPDDV